MRSPIHVLFLASATMLAAGTSGNMRVRAATEPSGIQIDHEGVGCVLAEQHPVFEAGLNPADKVQEARLRFRPVGGRHWYSVAMEQRGEAFTGILPKPKESLKGLDYYIEVTGEGVESSRTEEFSPRVVAGFGACQGEKVAAAMGAAVVSVAAPAGLGGAPLVPAGFSAAGVSAAGSTAAAGAGGGVSAKTLAIVGGVAAAGAGAALVLQALQHLDYQLGERRFEPSELTCPDGATEFALTVTILLDVTNNGGDSFAISCDGVLSLSSEAVQGPSSLGERGPGSQIRGLQGPCSAQPSQLPPGTTTVRIVSQPLCANPPDAAGFVDYSGLFFFYVPDDYGAKYTLHPENQLRILYP